MSKTFWLVSAGLAALATPAHAQNEDQTTTSPSGTEAASVEEGQAEQDIVITAQGRRQLLQDVPLAVQAVGGEQLQNSGANDIRQLNQLAPSLLVSSTGSEANGSARIRGIGTVGDNPGLESSVAVFIDGVYRSRSGIGLNELGEIDRVEVLRGPQGTLFGRNASAGLIHVITRRPEFQFGGMAELTYGNYDNVRAQGAVTGPISEALAFRLDAVYARRDGFLTVDDPQGGTESHVNDRDRLFVRGQLLFEPNDALSIRLIADYTTRDESCCGAVYLDRDTNPLIGNLNEPATPILVGPGQINPNGNNIINVLRDLGQPLAGFSDPYSRRIYVSPGRTYRGETEDAGISMEVNWELGGATLTSITAYRDYQAEQPGDFDYGAVDILYRDPEGGGLNRGFETFSQELRLQGSAFDGRFDWLVGAYYANENLTVADNLRFGDDYGRFATCRIISGSALAALYSPGSAGCLAARPALFGPVSPVIFAAFDRLDGINDRGSIRDVYEQDSRNYAFFTHNIFHITDQLDFTVGLRYTNERKRFDAAFTNDNLACVQNQQALLPLRDPTNPALAGLVPVIDGILGLSCQGNSTAELNGVSIDDRRSEDEFTGTGVLSWRPTDDVMFYASYSRGYKAGGFNLDRSALKVPIIPFAAVGGAQALVGNLQFDQEINDAYEIGIKYSRGPVTLNVVGFRQDFQNFQLNTFNGTVFLVQNINGCSNLVGGDGADEDLSAATGTCAPDDVGPGVRSEGVEVEAVLRPRRDMNLTLGMTYTNTRYRDNLVGNESGVPLDPALRILPGNRLSNAPELVFTSSFAWTPRLGNSGLSGLFYVDGRVTSDYNTGSDLFPQKAEDSYAIINARVGIRGDNERWSVELWAQNLFDTNYAQVAFNSPFQAGASSAPFVDPQFPGGRQIFSAYLAEPRTYGITGRFRF
ncbi:TonB-dependent receptor [Sphingosinicella terrae]|uniref:TonB-dependent receptor n=1 Tax=Sphingosinicella terrae TaxID=2172047 RepID=UPI000E0D35A7|nr:TonB-dependent receptor [Sphingosinicella terrae]